MYIFGFHQISVRAEQRLALCAVDDEELGCLACRRVELDVCGECSSTHTYYAAGLDLVKDFFAGTLYLLYYRFAAVDCRISLVAFHVDNDVRHHIAGYVGSGLDCRDGSGN